MILSPEEIRQYITPHQKRGHKYYLLSGFFDSLHPGHLAMIDAIPWCGASAIVVVNGDGAAIKKKGFYFMDANMRSKIMDHIKKVEYTCLWNESDVAGCLEIIRPDFFVNGGDRQEGNRDSKEEDVCKKYNIKPLYGFGGTDKPYSSSEILQRHANHILTKSLIKRHVKGNEQTKKEESS